MPCPNPVYPSPANQPLGGVAPRPLSPQRPSAPPPTATPTPTGPPALALRPSVVPVASREAPALAPTPQALGQVRQTGALGRLEPALARLSRCACVVAAGRSAPVSVGSQRQRILRYRTSDP
jgi:hypothetical protein